MSKLIKKVNYSCFIYTLCGWGLEAGKYVPQRLLRWYRSSCSLHVGVRRLWLCASIFCCFSLVYRLIEFGTFFYMCFRCWELASNLSNASIYVLTLISDDVVPVFIVFIMDLQHCE